MSVLSYRRLVGAISTLAVTAVMVLAAPVPAAAWDPVADLERAVLDHACPTAATIAALGAPISAPTNAATIVDSARAAESPLIGALFDMYFAARDGAPGTENTYALVDFAACFAHQVDVTGYEDRLGVAAGSIRAIDTQIQELVEDGAVMINGAVHTVDELAGSVVSLVTHRVDDASALALALLLDMLTLVDMLQYTSDGPPGVDEEAAARHETNDAEVALLESADVALDLLPPETGVAPRCKFRETQPGDREGWTNEAIFILTNDPIFGVKHDLYAVTTFRSTFLYNSNAKCLKFAAMPDGTFEFEDRTPFPQRITCGWRVLEPYGYTKYYEFLPGHPNSGFMMRGIFHVVFECDTGVIPFVEVAFDTDCPFNNVYAHYDGEASWYYGEGTSVCP